MLDVYYHTRTPCKNTENDDIDAVSDNITDELGAQRLQIASKGDTRLQQGRGGQTLSPGCHAGPSIEASCLMGFAGPMGITANANLRLRVKCTALVVDSPWSRETTSAGAALMLPVKRQTVMDNRTRQHNDEGGMQQCNIQAPRRTDSISSGDNPDRSALTALRQERKHIRIRFKCTP